MQGTSCEASLSTAQSSMDQGPALGQTANMACNTTLIDIDNGCGHFSDDQDILSAIQLPHKPLLVPDPEVWTICLARIRRRVAVCSQKHCFAGSSVSGLRQHPRSSLQVLLFSPLLRKAHPENNECCTWISDVGQGIFLKTLLQVCCYWRKKSERTQHNTPPLRATNAMLRARCALFFVCCFLRAGCWHRQDCESKFLKTLSPPPLPRELFVRTWVAYGVYSIVLKNRFG